MRFLLGSEIAMLDFIVCCVGVGLFLGAPGVAIWLFAATPFAAMPANEFGDACWRRYVRHTWWALGHLSAVAVGVFVVASYCQPAWTGWILAAAGTWLFAVAWLRGWSLSERELAVRRARNYFEYDVMSEVSGNGGILLLTTVGLAILLAGIVVGQQYSSEERLRHSLPSLQTRAEDLFDRLDPDENGLIYPSELEQAVFAGDLSQDEHKVAELLRDHFSLFSHSIGYRRCGKFTIEVFAIDRQDVAKITERVQRYLSR